MWGLCVNQEQKKNYKLRYANVLGNGGEKGELEGGRETKFAKGTKRMLRTPDLRALACHRESDLQAK